MAKVSLLLTETKQTNTELIMGWVNSYIHIKGGM